MKFLYEYRTSDNAKHTGVISSPNRDAAYAELKARGIRPSRFAEAPGVLNKIFGKGKRWLAIAVLAVLCLIAIAAVVGADRRAARTLHDAQTTLNVFDSPTRRQPIGDSAIIEKGIKTGWAFCFDCEGERFLASYAIPGVEPHLKTTSEAEVRRALATVAHPDETVESRQIVAIVEGMKNELRRFLADGGTIAAYGRCLVERQQQEIGYYERIETEIKTAIESGVAGEKLEALWESRNDALRKMGIKLVPMPE